MAGDLKEWLSKSLDLCFNCKNPLHPGPCKGAKNPKIAKTKELKGKEKLKSATDTISAVITKPGGFTKAEVDGLKDQFKKMTKEQLKKFVDNPKKVNTTKKDFVIESILEKFKRKATPEQINKVKDNAKKAATKPKIEDKPTPKVEAPLAPIPVPPVVKAPEPVKPAPQAPISPTDFKTIKTLPGSTKPKLVQDKDGKQFVLKSGIATSDGHVKSEVAADNVYAALGVATSPNSTTFTHQGTSYKKADYIEGGQSLAEWSKNKPKNQVDAMYKEISKHFVLDAVLANHDVIGLGKDNIMIKDGVPHRIDNGGSLEYRAQGLKKTNFGETPDELFSLRKSAVNPSAADVYGKLSNEDIKKQIEQVTANKSKIIEALGDNVSQAVKNKVAMRIDNLKMTFENGLKTEKSNKKFSDILDEVFDKKLPTPTPKAEPKKETPKTPYQKPAKLSTPEAKDVFATFTKDILPLETHGMKLIEKIQGNLAIKGIPASQHDVAETLKAEHNILFPPHMVTPSTFTPTVEQLKPLADKQKIYNEVDKGEKYYQGLKKNQKEALKSYTGSGYKTLNALARKCPPKFECLEGEYKTKQKVLMDTIDTYSKDNKFENPIQLGRGIGVKSNEIESFIAGFNNLKEGNIPYQFPSITSTSHSGAEFGGNVTFRLTARTGLPAEKFSSVGSQEKEFLVSPTAKFKVIKVESSGNYKHTIHLEEIE